MHTAKLEDLRSVLKNLGYKKDEANKRADYAMSQLGESASLESLMKVALQKPKAEEEVPVLYYARPVSDQGPSKGPAGHPVYVNPVRADAKMRNKPAAPKAEPPAPAAAPVPQAASPSRPPQSSHQEAARALKEAQRLERKAQRKLETLRKMERLQMQRERQKSDSKFPWIFAICFVVALKYFGCL